MRQREIGDNMPNVKMELSTRAYKEFKTMMKKMGFSDEDAFVKYCVLKTIKPYVPQSEKKDVTREITELKRYYSKSPSLG